MRILLLTLVLLGLAASAAHAKPVFTFSSADCREVVMDVPVADPERLRRELPPGWELRPTFTQRFGIYVTIVECATLNADGVRVPSAGFADVVTTAEPPNGGDDVAYLLRSWSDHPQHVRGMRRAGVRGGAAPMLSAVLDEPGGVAVGGRAALGTADGGAYAIDMPGGPLAVLPFFASDGFTVGAEGPAGRVRLIYELLDTRVAFGPATFTASPGSDLAELVGATTVRGVGNIGRYGISHTVTADRPLPPEEG